MQCPPTRPGSKVKKFHFVPAASKTSLVSIPSLSKIIESSFISAIFKSRWIFSITLAASAVLISLALKTVKVARTALESTIISVPKLKLHASAGVTLSIKNMMGAMKPKGSMHTNLSRNIADLASILRPSVAVVDGIIAGEGHETSNDPVEMNLVIAGTDPVAVDAVGAAVMGVPPDSVKHLRYAVQRGLGTCDLDKIEVVGESIQKVKRQFRKSLSSRILGLLA